MRRLSVPRAAWQRAASFAIALALCGLCPLALASAERLVDGAPNIEDLASLPGGRWLIGSSMAVGETPGKLFAIDRATDEATPLFPMGPTSAPKADGKDVAGSGYCPGPIDPARFAPHGIVWKERGHRRGTLYVVNHGGREAIEVFSVSMASGESMPTIVWQGCFALPEGAAGNSVAAHDNGMLYVTASGSAFGDSGGSTSPAESAMPPSGVLVWKPQTGWESLTVAGLEFANGIALANGGEMLYVADWTGRSLWAVDPGRPADARRLRLDFFPDNVRLAPDGALWAAGHTSPVETTVHCFLSEHSRCEIDSAVARIDTKDLTVACSQRIPAGERFGGATVALADGSTVWLGSFRAAAVKVMKRRAQAAVPLSPDVISSCGLD